jgi:DNA-binding response OmpR family regulator
VRILSLEDNKEFQLLISESLRNIFTVDFSETLSDFAEKIKNYKYNGLLIDLKLTEGNGFDAFNIYTNHYGPNQIPIIFITGDDRTQSLVDGLGLGADDYIIKPISMKALAARVSSNINKFYKRARMFSLHEEKLIEVDLENSKVMIHANNSLTNIFLTPIEFKIFFLLYKNKGTVFSRKELVSSIWGESYYIDNRIVDKHMSSLRYKLKPYDKAIKTIPKSGYLFQDPSCEKSLTI